ncbi:MAG TPA: GNAT family N-acetyltransferase [Blastocatellia bacterium]|nr:GNAT family N-acetyltransferase [Blastocatellia bacterium]
MSLPVVGQARAAMSLKAPSDAGNWLAVQTLRAEHEAEVLDFLAARPVHTVFLAGFIRDNGLESELNRGTFHAYRDRQGRLEGVALIGHFTLVEARSEAALAAFAGLAQDCHSTHMILGEKDNAAALWSYFAQSGRTPRRVCRELLFEQQSPMAPLEHVSGLRQATSDDLPVILPLNAEMVCQESGINPLEVDPSGFELRWQRRIEQGRVWVWIESGRLIFNADVMSETPDVIYLEGIYVHPDERGKGYGARCLSQLSRDLLQRAKSICLLVNEEHQQSHAFYRSAGFTLSAYYDSIFLHLNN